MGVCKACETLIEAPVPPHVIDKDVPTTGLLAQVLVAKYSDHLPLYRQEQTLVVRDRPSRDPRWVLGWGDAACSCSRWSTHSARPSCIRASYIPLLNRSMAPRPAIELFL